VLDINIFTTLAYGENAFTCNSDWLHSPLVPTCGFQLIKDVTKLSSWWCNDHDRSHNYSKLNFNHFCTCKIRFAYEDLWCSVLWFPSDQLESFDSIFPPALLAVLLHNVTTLLNFVIFRKHSTLLKRCLKSMKLLNGQLQRKKSGFALWNDWQRFVDFRSVLYL